MQPAKVLVLDFFQAFSCSCWAGFMGLALPLPLPHNVPGVAPTRVAHPAIPKVLSGQVYFRHNLLKPSSATQATTEIRCPIPAVQKKKFRKSCICLGSSFISF